MRSRLLAIRRLSRRLRHPRGPNSQYRRRPSFRTSPAGAEPEPVAEPLQVAASEVDEIRPNTGSVREIETLEAPAASDASAPADQPESDSSVPALAGITGSIALATGLLLLERRRRMRRASVGAEHYGALDEIPRR